MTDKQKTKLSNEEIVFLVQRLEANEDTQLAAKVYAGLDNLKAIETLKSMFEPEEEKKEEVKK